mmetsp:Transcript_52463/g.125352  ORF Transcript_52463/g.125352 Transcript_52463/m.125352 type:complete len:784 (+) Transcript_52463:173-2524(+)
MQALHKRLAAAIRSSDIELGEQQGGLPAAATARSRTDAAISDIILDKDLPALAPQITSHLNTKGYCVVDPVWKTGVISTAYHELRSLRKGEQLVLEALPEEIKDGLLGSDGSYRIAEIRKPLLAADSLLLGMESVMDAFRDQFSGLLEHRKRTSTLVNISGAPDEFPPALTEQLVAKWREVFLLHRVMVLICLGPREGILELQAYAAEDEPDHITEVATIPGRIILLRPDCLWHTHIAPCKTSVLSCFLLAPKPPWDFVFSSWQLTPCVEVLEEWMFLRLQERKTKESTETGVREVSPEDVPAEWLKRMNHLFFKGHSIGIYGLSARVPSEWDIEKWYSSQFWGVDTAASVPLTRWLHMDTFVEPNNELSWMENKSYCAHGAFMDGVELFDHKFFNIGKTEAENIDPHQRHILEVSYEILNKQGMLKSNILGSKCGIYVGMSHQSDWDYAVRDPGLVGDDRVHSGTASATAIASNRVSFCLGMKGPSMTLDTDSASGLSAIHTAAESVEPRGRRVTPCQQSLALGAHLILSREWWPMHCARRHLSLLGRCMSFNDECDGYVFGDTVAGLVLKCHNPGSDGTVADQAPPYGTLAGISMSNNGRSASLSTMSGPAQMQVVYSSLCNASISPMDVDAVESYAPGELLRDSIEGTSVVKTLRGELAQEEPLLFLSSKSAYGHSMAASGTTSFLRALLSCQWGWMAPILHLEMVNSNMNLDIWSGQLVTEVATHRLETSYVSTLAYGFGGTNVGGLIWGRSVYWSDDEAPAQNDALAAGRLPWLGSQA